MGNYLFTLVLKMNTLVATEMRGLYMLKKLKERWEIDSNFQIAVILAVFSLAGYTIVFVRKFEYGLLGITPEDSIWLKVGLWPVIIMPQYYVFLLIYGTIAGQFRFFWKFARKSFGRFNPKNWGRRSSEAG